jgi:hypothetical protein
MSTPLPELDKRSRAQHIQNVMVSSGGVAVLGSYHNVRIGKTYGKKLKIYFAAIANDLS